MKQLVAPSWLKGSTSVRRCFSALLILLLPGLLFMKPVFVTPDGPIYYSTTKSLYYDHDLVLNNNFVHCQAYARHYPFIFLNAEGVFTHPFPVGSAVLNVPFFMIGDLTGRAMRQLGLRSETSTISRELFSYLPSPRDDVLIIYFYSLGACVSLLLCFFFTFLFARDQSVGVAHFPGAASAVLYGTPLFFYTFYKGMFSHVYSALFASVFLFLWFRAKDNPSFRRVVVLGVISGAMILIRWHNVVYLSVPLVYVLFRRSTAAILLLLPVSILVFAPQLLVWKQFHGQFFPIAQGASFFRFLQPELTSMLFSPWHGLLFYSPVILLSLVGCYWLFKKDRVLFFSLISPFLLSLYVNSAEADWWAGWSFGARRFVNLTPLFVFFLLFALEGLKKKALLVAFPAVCWSISLMLQYLLHLISPFEFVPVGTIMKNHLYVAAHFFPSLAILIEKGLIAEICLHGTSLIVVLSLTVVIFAGLFILLQRVSGRVGIYSQGTGVPAALLGGERSGGE